MAERRTDDSSASSAASRHTVTCAAVLVGFAAGFLLMAFATPYYYQPAGGHHPPASPTAAATAATAVPSARRHSGKRVAAVVTELRFARPTATATSAPHADEGEIVVSDGEQAHPRETSLAPDTLAKDDVTSTARPASAAPLPFSQALRRSPHRNVTIVLPAASAPSAFAWSGPPCAFGAAAIMPALDMLLPQSSSQAVNVSQGEDTVGAVLVQVGFDPHRAARLAQLRVSRPATDAILRNSSSSNSGGRLFRVLVDPIPLERVDMRRLGYDLVVEAAVALMCGEVALYFKPDDATQEGTGILRPRGADDNASSVVRVASVPLARVLAALARVTGLRVHLLVIDAQGFDEAILLSGLDGTDDAQLQHLSRVDHVIVECQHLDSGDSRQSSADAGNCANTSATLQRLGFRFGYCLWDVGVLEMTCWFYHHRFEQPHHARRAANHTVPPSLRSFAGDAVFRVMCPTFLVGTTYGRCCKLPAVVWGDPAGLAGPASFAVQCEVFAVMDTATPALRRKNRHNQAMLRACRPNATKTYMELLQSGVTAPRQVSFRKKKVLVRSGVDDRRG